MERKISTTEARKRFTEITDDVRVNGNTYAIMRHNKVIAYIVPPDNRRDHLEIDPELQKDLDRVFTRYGDALKALADK